MELQETRDGIDRGALEGAAGRKDSEGVLLATPLDKLEASFGAKIQLRIEDLVFKAAEASRPGLARALTRALQSGTFAAAPPLRLPGSGAIIPTLDRTNPSALEWIEGHSALLVREITEETRLHLRELIRRSFAEGIPPRQLGILIRQEVGLTTRMGLAVERAAARLFAQGGTADQVAALREELSSRLIRWRAMNIAKTETIRASNMGQQFLWREAVDEGLLSKDSKRVWLTAPDERRCPYCAAMEGKEVGMEEEFPSGSVETRVGPRQLPPTLVPPLHPMCRCSVALRAVAGPGLAGPHRRPRAPAKELPDMVTQFRVWNSSGRAREEIVGTLSAEERKAFEQSVFIDKWLTEGLPLEVHGSAAETTNVHRAFRKHELVEKLGKRLEALGEEELEAFLAEFQVPIPKKFMKTLPQLSKTAELTFVEAEVTRHQWLAYETANALVKQWALTSADQHPIPLALQRIVKRELAKGGVLSHLESRAGYGGSEHILKAHDRVLTSFVRAMYEETQTALQAAGIEEIVVYRGVQLGQTKVVNGKVVAKKLPRWLSKPGEPVPASIPLQPASSFAADPRTAVSFAGSHEGSVLFVIRVPRKKVLGSARTGWGCLNESEWVILGGKVRGKALHLKGFSSLTGEFK